MQDSFSILSPAGYVMDVGVVCQPGSGIGNFGGVVVTPNIPGGRVQLQGAGEFPAQGLSGRQGTIYVNLTLGATGTNRAVVFLTADLNLTLGVAVDTGNRPFVVITDNLGSVVAESLPIGPNLPAGSTLTLRMAWDSGKPVFGGVYAALNAKEQVSGWATSPITVWGSFTPTAILVGSGVSSLALSAFNGTVNKVVISDQVSFTPEVGASIAENLGLFSSMGGDSSLTFDASVLYAAESSLSGDSGVTADANLV